MDDSECLRCNVETTLSDWLLPAGQNVTYIFFRLLDCAQRELRFNVTVVHEPSCGIACMPGENGAFISRPTLIDTQAQNNKMGQILNKDVWKVASFALEFDHNF